jgi:hypothetical protein
LKRTCFVVVAACAAFAFAGRADAGLMVGDDLSAFFQATGVGVYAGPSDVTFALPNVSISNFNGLSPPGAFNVEFAPTSITIDVVQPVLFNGGFTFNGMVITDNNPNLAGATLGTNTLAGFTNADFSSTSTSVSLNFPGLTFASGQTLVINLPGTAVPEPSTIVSAGAAATVGLACFLRRRRAVS